MGRWLCWMFSTCESFFSPWRCLNVEPILMHHHIWLYVHCFCLSLQHTHECSRCCCSSEAMLHLPNTETCYNHLKYGWMDGWMDGWIWRTLSNEMQKHSSVLSISLIQYRINSCSTDLLDNGFCWSNSESCLNKLLHFTI